MRAACLNKEFRALYLRQTKALGDVLRQAAEQGQIRPVRADAAGFIVYEITRGLVTQRLLGCSMLLPIGGLWATSKQKYPAIGR
jgi:hypothetical protein